MVIYNIFVYQTSLKLAFPQGHNNHSNLSRQLENSKWILCSQKTGIECEY